MKTKIETVIDEYEDLLSGQVNYFLFRLFNICLKADGTALLAVKVTVKGEEKNIEDVAEVGKNDDYQYCIIPNDEDYFKPITKAIFMIHPELKMKIMAMDENGLTPLSDDEIPKDKLKVIVATLPDVDKDRHDVIVDAINTFYDECKVNMENYKQKYTVKLSTTIEGMDNDVVDSAKDDFDKITKDYTQKRDSIRDKKKKEADDAYQCYLSQQEAQDAKKKEEELATNKEAGLNLNMFSNED